jgi:HD-GYP domain-containing protein (c-di-GMP phosphodiesterase class II)
MLKKIPVSELRLGMHLHALDGPWLSHPFWRTRFVIESSDDLKKLHGSAVTECWIDPGLGLDVAGPAAPAAPAPQPAVAVAPAQPAAARPAAVAAAAAVSPRPPGPKPATRSMEEELRQAAAICSRGRTAVVSMFNEARMGRTVDAEGCLPLVEDITASVQRNPGALVSLARLKTQDDYSFMHSVAVCALMVSMARQMGFDETQTRLAGLAGLVHDVGKAVMPLDVLNKPGRLTDAEFDVIRSHPERGHALLLDGQGTTPEMLDVVLHHHERVDGTGYPHRLAGDGISQLARMGAICDVYDAITSNRPYKRGWDPADSISRMASWKGHFDPTLFAIFVRSLGIYPTGSLVRLQSERLAVVIEQNPQALVSPVVKAFFSVRQDMPIPPKVIDLASKNCNDRIMCREQGADERFPHLAQLWADPEALRRSKG